MQLHGQFSPSPLPRSLLAGEEGNAAAVINLSSQTAPLHYRLSPAQGNHLSQKFSFPLNDFKLNLRIGSADCSSGAFQLECTLSPVTSRGLDGSQGHPSLKMESCHKLGIIRDLTQQNTPTLPIVSPHFLFNKDEIS